MRFGQASVGDRMVFDNQGGVWEKIDNGRAKLVFGRRDRMGEVVTAVGSDFVYVIDEKPVVAANGQEPTRVQPAQQPMRGGDEIKVVFHLTDDEKVLAVVPMSPVKASILARCENVMIIVDGREAEYEVDQVMFRVDSNEMGVGVSR